MDGALLSTLVTAAIGLAAATFPDAWLHLFSSDAQVVKYGSAYLTRAAPFYALFGAGMSLYFASQGAGRMAWPFAAGMARLCIVAIGGSYWIHGLDGSLNGLYWIAAAGYLVSARSMYSRSQAVSAGGSFRLCWTDPILKRASKRPMIAACTAAAEKLEGFEYLTGRFPHLGISFPSKSGQCLQPMTTLRRAP